LTNALKTCPLFAKFKKDEVVAKFVPLMRMETLIIFAWTNAHFIEMVTLAQRYVL
jgi:hypothetical protein